MLSIRQNVSLLPYNTFHIDVRARYFTIIRNMAELEELRMHPLFMSGKKLFLGGGSNVLFTGDFDGLVIKNELTGIRVVKETDTVVHLQAGSGENWHSFVMYCVERNLGGLENLSLIPGTVGAAPMQNIGAYGVEVKDVIEEVEAIELATGKVRIFSRDDCQFGYRESFFKHEGREKYFISSVTLSASKKNHRYNTSYGAIKETLAQKGVAELSVKAISDAVIHIRRTKLPDPEVVGNAGSFFKNPSIPSSQYQALKSLYPTIPGYPEPNDVVKVPAGWLIEQCGWKGKTFSPIGIHPHQALVLVNYGGGEGKKIMELSKEIQRSVADKFNITLHAEVNIIEA